MTKPCTDSLLLTKITHYHENALQHKYGQYNNRVNKYSQLLTTSQDNRKCYFKNITLKTKHTPFQSTCVYPWFLVRFMLLDLLFPLQYSVDHLICVLFLLVVVLFVCLKYMTYYYSYGIFKLFETDMSYRFNINLCPFNHATFP